MAVVTLVSSWRNSLLCAKPYITQVHVLLGIDGAGGDGGNSAVPMPVPV